MLDVLRDAGVVDAGGAGLVEIVRGMVYGATGEELPEVPVETESLEPRCDPPGAVSEYRYCTVFVVEGEELDSTRSSASSSRSATRCSSSATRRRSRCTSTPTTRAWRSSLGTAVGVVEGVEIANMHHQTAQREERLLDGVAVAHAARSRRGSSRSARGAGNRRLFESLGATSRHRGRPDDEPVRRGHPRGDRGGARTTRCIVLPNNSNVVLTAEQAAALSDEGRARRPVERRCRRASRR